MTTHSFDPQIYASPFPSQDTAIAALREDFETERRIDTEENGWDTQASIADDGTYARIINHFADRDDTTEFHVVALSERKGRGEDEIATTEFSPIGKTKIIVFSGIVSDIRSTCGEQVEFEVIDYDKDYEDEAQLSEYIDEIQSDPSYIDCPFTVARFSEE